MNWNEEVVCYAQHVHKKLFQRSFYLFTTNEPPYSGGDTAPVHTKIAFKLSDNPTKLCHLSDSGLLNRRHGRPKERKVLASPVASIIPWQPKEFRIASYLSGKHARWPIPLGR